MSSKFNVVALVSGGKDSTMNMMRCEHQGHKIVALANLFPEGDEDELDSFMYQTVGHDAVESISACMQLPMYRRPIRKGRSLNVELQYEQTEGDEVEELYKLLKFVMHEHPSVNAVASGAILSNYQRIRVETVCMRLGLVSLAYLWQSDQKELLDDMIASDIEAILIKVACIGLTPDRNLGQTLLAARPTLLRVNEDYGCHICGEGGEYETFTLDCPLFKSRIVVDETRTIMHQDDDYAPVAYLKFQRWHLVSKTEEKEPAAPNVTIVSDKLIEDKKVTMSSAEAPYVSASPATEHRDVTCYIPAFSLTSHEGKEMNGQVESSVTVEEEMEALLKLLQEELKTKEVGLSSVAFVSLYLDDMSNFAGVNKVYSKVFPLRCPAARMCVGLPLSGRAGDRIMIEVCANDCAQSTLHVQSISHWAPCNIGPYSQAKTIQEKVVHVSGQIALEPASMTLEGADCETQICQCLRNLEAILSECNSANRQIFKNSVFLVDISCACRAQQVLHESLSSDFARPLTSFIEVSSLPRGAQVELQVAAFTSSLARGNLAENFVSRECRDGMLTLSCGIVSHCWSFVALMETDATSCCEHAMRMMETAVDDMAEFELEAQDVASCRLWYVKDSLPPASLQQVSLLLRSQHKFERVSLLPAKALGVEDEDRVARGDLLLEVNAMKLGSPQE